MLVSCAILTKFHSTSWTLVRFFPFMNYRYMVFHIFTPRECLCTNFTSSRSEPFSFLILFLEGDFFVLFCSLTGTGSLTRTGSLTITGYSRLTENQSLTRTRTTRRSIFVSEFVLFGNWTGTGNLAQTGYNRLTRNQSLTSTGYSRLTENRSLTGTGSTKRSIFVSGFALFGSRQKFLLMEFRNDQLLTFRLISIISFFLRIYLRTLNTYVQSFNFGSYFLMYFIVSVYFKVFIWLGDLLRSRFVKMMFLVGFLHFNDKKSIDLY